MGDYRNNGSRKERVQQTAYHGRRSEAPSRAFDFPDRVQKFTGEVYVLLSTAPKVYQHNICDEVRHYCREATHEARRANEAPLGSMERGEHQDALFELLKDINDLFPILKTCHIVSGDQEARFKKKVDGLRWGLQRWTKSDIERIRKEIMQMRNKSRS